MSTQLLVNGRLRVSLNLYSATPDAFDKHARTLAGLFGIQAAMLLYGADTKSHLQRAVDSRDLIGQAKGILREALLPRRRGRVPDTSCGVHGGRAESVPLEVRCTA